MKRNTNLDGSCMTYSRENRQIKRKASQIAGYTCFLHACAKREEDPRFRKLDYLAEATLPLGDRFIICITAIVGVNAP
ncbi:MAG: hypothetical protein A2Y88_06810 [Chloroflexi bacterium RBG_13_48_10]|nr:MAG: hypothetical protein A2Y88_06810 [Chloroflexi bacterium RBG_13_48_10]